MEIKLEKQRPADLVKLVGVPDGWDARYLAEIANHHCCLMHVCRDDARLESLHRCLKFFAPETTILNFPAWDCLPYDRVSPNSEITSHRLEALASLSERSQTDQLILLTTVNAVTQRLPPKSFFTNSLKLLEIGKRYPIEELIKFLEHNGFWRTATVREPGEYAIRGGILDLFPSTVSEPIRLDFFGDELDQIRVFDPFTQRTVGTKTMIKLRPVAELLLDEKSIQRFRNEYRKNFGAEISNDPIYVSISEGRRHVGMEHWLPLFHRKLETLFDYKIFSAVSFDDQAENIAAARFELIQEYFESRQTINEQKIDDVGSIYRPVPPNLLYLDSDEFQSCRRESTIYQFNKFAIPQSSLNKGISVIASRTGTVANFVTERTNPNLNLYKAVSSRVSKEIKKGRKVILCAFTSGSRSRLISLLKENGIDNVVEADTYQNVLDQPSETVAAINLPIEQGFTTDNSIFITETDILGERLIRPSRRKRRKGEEFLQEISSLSEGDYVVHDEHGIGQYEALETLEIGGAPHDCLRLLYLGGDKLFLPVENIDLLSRYGSEASNAILDKLGGLAWQARKARVKKRLRDMATSLIRIAAERKLNSTERVRPVAGVYDEFCSRFPYNETDDQITAIADTLDDVAKGRPMDRLVCGDVGFGKTEVALRAAMVVAMEGFQVAVVAPTTLLCRQHFQVFRDRFQHLPVKIRQLSRLINTKEAGQVRSEIASGDCNIIIGTHALLGKSVDFNNLALLIIDEEQHFGVAQKERLKELRSNIHVLTLTATPIPRTLQLALTGVRDLSLIATPPVDRLSVRTFVMPFDGMVIKEAIQRERNRGGQTFYVCPRVEDLPRVYDRITKLVPDVKVGTAHGRLVSAELETVMSAFCDGAFDVLLSTNIIESGLDIPNANTIIIHRADMFGLAQLYQLRGRVGRSKTRAYAYLTTHPNKLLRANARRRLEAMQTLDNLGAGFSLASHDMDIRGAGNLLGEEQSGQIKEVGIELYQHLLNEAVVAAKETKVDLVKVKEQWVPQISLGMPVFIPDSYVPDLTVRLSIYRRIANLEDSVAINEFGGELEDRFGKIPQEVENLLKIIGIKQLCRTAGIEKVEAGPKGAILSFRNDEFENLSGLVEFLGRENRFAKLRADHKLVYRQMWNDPEERVRKLTKVIRDLAELAA